MTRPNPVLPILLFFAVAAGACSNVESSDPNQLPDAEVVPSSTSTTQSTTTTTTPKSTTTPAPSTTTTQAPTTTTTSAPPSGGSIESATLTIDTVVSDDGGGGTFTATGDAVDSGHFCAAGVFTNVDFDFGGDPHWFEDSYTCEGVSGSIVLRVETPVADDEDDEEGRQDVLGTWTVASATGQWEGVSGAGEYHGSFDPWVETYEGALSFG